MNKTCIHDINKYFKKKHLFLFSIIYSLGVFLSSIFAMGAAEAC